MTTNLRGTHPPPSTPQRSAGRQNRHLSPAPSRARRYIYEMSATALCRGPDGAWGVVLPRFIETIDEATKALGRDKFAAFTAWLAQLSLAAGGQTVHMLAHN